MTRATLAAVFLGAVLAFAQAVAAFATPLACPMPQAEPQAADCTAPPPAPGESFAGPVMQVEGPADVCVALGPTPDRWVRVSIADAAPGGTRGGMMAAAFAHDVVCIAIGAGDGGAVGVRAVCVEDGVSIGLLAADPGFKAASWR